MSRKPEVPEPQLMFEFAATLVKEANRTGETVDKVFPGTLIRLSARPNIDHAITVIINAALENRNATIQVVSRLFGETEKLHEQLTQ